jgi:ubiquinone/menaquinone biosynthesis C-methylase UbiE
MERIPELELMNGPQHALAYARANFTEPHDRFVTLFQEKFRGEKINGYVVDLGCGPADVTIRFSRAYPDCIIQGVDGAENMLIHGRKDIADLGLESRITLHLGRLPQYNLPRASYDVIISNSLLHHLPDPMVLWDCIKSYGSPGAIVYVMDLFRPPSQHEARSLVDQYAGNEPAILQDDFYHSLCASFRLEEVRRQLEEAGLGHLSAETVSDRHLVAYGRL